MSVFIPWTLLHLCVPEFHALANRPKSANIILCVLLEKFFWTPKGSPVVMHSYFLIFIERLLDVNSTKLDLKKVVGPAFLGLGRRVSGFCCQFDRMVSQLLLLRRHIKKTFVMQLEMSQNCVMDSSDVWKIVPV